MHWGKLFMCHTPKDQYQPVIWQHIMVLSFAYCNIPVMPIRHEPFHRSEQVNQLLFGERMEVLEINDRDWVKICSEWDHYEGWCKSAQIKHIQRKEYRKDSRVMVNQHGSKLIF